MDCGFGIVGWLDWVEVVKSHVVRLRSLRVEDCTTMAVRVGVLIV